MSGREHIMAYAVVFNCFNDPRLRGIWCCTVLYRNFKLLNFWWLSHYFAFCVFLYLWAPPHVLWVGLICTAMFWNCGLSNAKISVSAKKKNLSIIPKTSCQSSSIFVKFTGLRRDLNRHGSVRWHHSKNCRCFSTTEVFKLQV